MTGSDPDYISAMEHFEAMRHEDIYQATQQIDAGEILRLSGTWMHAAATLQSTFPLTRANANLVMNEAEWEGEAADAAEACTRSFSESIEELAGVVGQVGLRLGAVAAAAEAVKIAVVPPGDTGPVGALARLLEAAKVIDADMVQEVLRQEAVLTMNMVYKPAYTTAGSGVPALPEPPPPPGALPPLSPPITTPQLTSDPAQPSSTGTTPDDANPEPPPDQPGTIPAPPPTEPAPAPSPEGQTPPPETPAPTDNPSPAPLPAPAPTEHSPAPAPPETPPAPAPPAPAQPPAAEAPPVPNDPGPAPPPPPSGQTSSGAPLSDPAGQPGITGPVPGRRAPDQPGVIPGEL
ncbi:MULTISPECIES: hypothetical protein [Nocardia]|uniref:hypothetical protein n=1 Tax=Nocardia TaxID=1817 RepID=UPI001893FEFA|nr:MULTISPECIES: hypothetical protein [Nocardia]MBF6351272.1 hypothetical protein [Nocardia flavorosea]